MKILFTGGGTGGHIFPIISIVREIRRIKPKNKLEFFYLGPKDEFASIFLSQEDIKVKTIFAGKIRRYFSLENFIDIFRILIGIPQAFLFIFFSTPDIVFSKGGYGSFPVVLSAWLLRVPIFLHESDATPGLVNRILNEFALEIFVSFPRNEFFPVEKMILVGNPIRREILMGSKEKAKELFNLSEERPVILVLGGSQGAQKINDILLIILPEILKEFEVIHQCGERNFKQIRAEANVTIPRGLQKHYHIFPFLKESEMAHSYQAADIVISRAGSGSIFEIAASGKPSILIPLKTAAQNHQIKNAYQYSQAGAAIVIEEENLTSHFFLKKIKYLISHPNEVEEMKKKAKEFGRPKAAKIIAEYIVGYLSK
ncbi:undecaprenyldiphospho-muramoylpentapeptide beta-N-acetylglucosaminyltransferase [Candidatus Parcubacteria bacterium]|nr:undecaprenyldiphospho-muramoylpentapeptide beta-N-acetylglucosaminyltransferase [Candidatus Parcubacteria bacterium]